MKLKLKSIEHKSTHFLENYNLQLPVIPHRDECIKIQNYQIKVMGVTYLTYDAEGCDAILSFVNYD